jgi:hypothetical protein
MGDSCRSTVAIAVAPFSGCCSGDDFDCRWASAASSAYQSGSAFFGTFTMLHLLRRLQILLSENQVSQATAKPLGGERSRLHYQPALPQTRLALRKDCSKFQPIRYALQQAAILQNSVIDSFGGGTREWNQEVAAFTYPVNPQLLSRLGNYGHAHRTFWQSIAVCYAPNFH